MVGRCRGHSQRSGLKYQKLKSNSKVHHHQQIKKLNQMVYEAYNVRVKIMNSSECVFGLLCSSSSTTLTFSLKRVWTAPKTKMKNRGQPSSTLTFLSNAVCSHLFHLSTHSFYRHRQSSKTSSCCWSSAFEVEGVSLDSASLERGWPSSFLSLTIFQLLYYLFVVSEIPEAAARILMVTLCTNLWNLA